jgi:DNA-directed RNA polymerase specialized sigma24 family protein
MINCKVDNAQGDSIAIVLQQLQKGERSNVDFLLERYLHRLRALAATKLASQPELVDYAEDVALSTLKSLCLGAERGRFADLKNDGDLWRLMAMITVRKTISLRRSQRPCNQATEFQLAQILSEGPTADDLVQMDARIDDLFEKLGDDELRRIARLKFEGYSNNEIAIQLSCVVRTIERRLHRIRSIWQKELAQ